MASPMDIEVTTELNRYIGYKCDYHACKYKDEGITWGDLYQKDPEHFLELLSYHVGATTNTFEVLSQLLTPDQRERAKCAVRRVNTPEYQKEQEDFYLNLTCNYKGKSNGKKWKDIKDNNYSFFVWAVGNAMGRDTKSFNVFKRCLKPEDQKMIEETEKGKVRPKRRKMFNPIRNAAAAEAILAH